MIDVNLLRRVRTLLFDLDMGKYIDADRLRVEIEKTYKSEIQPWISGVSATSTIYDYVLPLIDSLQQERLEVDLEKEIEEYFGEDWKDGTPIEVQDDMIKFARHFYNLGLNARKED